MKSSIVKTKECTLWLGRHKTVASGFWVYIENVIVLLCRELGERGVSVRIVGAGNPEGESALLELFKNTHIDVEIRWLNDPLGNRYLGHLRDALFLGMFSGVFHGMSNTVPLFGGGDCNIVTIHDLLQAYPIGGKRGFFAWCKSQYYRFYLRWILVGRVSRIITGHPKTKHEILERYPVSQESIRVVYPPLSPLFCEPVELQDTEPYLLAFMSTDPRKNIDRVLCAFDKIDDGTELRILVATPQLKESLMEKISQYSCSGAIKVLVDVSREELYKLFRHATGTLFPSLAEGFGYPIYESLSQGTPVLTSRDLVIQEIEETNGCIVECDPMSVEDIKMGIEKLIELSLTADERKRASCKVQEVLAPHECVAQILEVLLG